MFPNSNIIINPDIWEYNEELNALFQGHSKNHCNYICAFKDGKWAEIVEQPKEIDWLKEGQLVQGKESNCIVLTSGIYTTDNCFGGVVIADNSYKTGYYSEDFRCDDFKPYTGEPIILKP